MSRQVTYTVEISPTGEKRIEVHGAVGGTCEDVTRPLEERLSGVETERTYKDSYHQSQGTGVDVSG